MLVMFDYKCVVRMLCRNDGITVNFAVSFFKTPNETIDVIAVNVGRKIIKQLKTGHIGDVKVDTEFLRLKGKHNVHFCEKRKTCV